jgi:hypothetical protein
MRARCSSASATIWSAEAPARARSAAARASSPMPMLAEALSTMRIGFPGSISAATLALPIVADSFEPTPM